MKRLKLTQAMYLTVLACSVCTATGTTLMAKSKAGAAIFVMSDKTYSNIYATHKIYEYYNDYISLHQTIPQIRGLDDKVFEKQLNKSIYKTSLENRKDIIKLSNSYNKNLVKDKLPGIKFEYTESFSIIPSIKPYYNIAQFKYKYSGGAHGENTVNYIVLNTQTNSVVSLGDLFKPNINYLDILNNELRVQLESLQENSKLPLYKDPSDIKISNTQEFYIDMKGNIVLVFNVYEIAPYASGIIEVSIPTSNISMYMK